MLFDYQPPKSPLDILYQDKDIIVLNKPCGLLSVPGRQDHMKDSLSLRVQAQFPSATVVHRLDMDTSGIMLMTLNKEAHRHISKQFEKRVTEKSYIAHLYGNLEQEEGEIDLPLILDWPNRPLHMVDPENGKPALTRWKVLDRLPDYTRVVFTPSITGPCPGHWPPHLRRQALCLWDGLKNGSQVNAACHHAQNTASLP